MTHQNFPIPEMVKTLKVSSEAFEHRGYISPKNTCDGDNVNPPLFITNIPKETKSLAVIVDDADAPVRPWVHWIVWNIPVTKHIQENTIPGNEGINDFGNNHYGGPCPPEGTHKYFFKVYALDTLLELKASATKIDLEKALSQHIIGFGEIIGLYKRAL